MPVYRKYRGESSPKKFARYTFWSTVAEEMGDAFIRSDFLVLSSEEAGDVSVLLAMGVPAEHIVAVDIDATAVKKASAKFPNVEFHHAEVGRYLQTTKHVFGAIYLDFCSALNPETIRTACIAAQWLHKKHGMLGVGFMVGREHHYQEWFQNERVWLSDSPEQALIVRGRLIDQKVGCVTPAWLYPRWLGRYRSTTAKGRGAPMGIYLGGRQKPSGNIKISVFEPGSADITPLALELGDRALGLLNITPTTLAAIRANATRRGIAWNK